MEQGQYKYSINKVHLKNGEPFKPGRINVFVGANNCGKTQLLKDMLAYITGKREELTILENLDIPYPDSWDAMEKAYKIKPVETSNGLQLRHICPTLDKDPSGPSHHDLRQVLDSWLQHDLCQYRSATGPGFVTYLNTDNRLKLAMGQQVQKDLQNRGAKNLLEALYLSGVESTQNVRKCISSIFDNTDVYLDSSNLGMLQFRVGADFSSIPDNPQAAFEKLRDLAVLDDQGDGLRSVLGIITALVALKKPIILLDEPEAFLHPPQAMQLGKIISTLVKESQQIFIATHSADFLRGLLGTTRDAVIVHLDRPKDSITEARILDSDALSQIITDPLISSSRVLEGMFYKGVVATEADSDTAFYQRLFQKIGASDEIHFLQTSGKQALKKIISPYQKLGIKFAIIADADVIRERNDVKSLLNLTSEETAKEQILVERDEVIKYFQTQSKYDRLLSLQTALHNLISAELPAETNSDDIDKALTDYRAKLGKLRDESDDLSKLKELGRECFPDEEKEHFDRLCSLCSNIGLFIVWVGELESWLVDYGIERTSNKPKWIAEALMKIYEIEPDNDKAIWKFVYSLRDFLIN